MKIIVHEKAKVLFSNVYIFTDLQDQFIKQTANRLVNAFNSQNNVSTTERTSVKGQQIQHLHGLRANKRMVQKKSEAKPI